MHLLRRGLDIRDARRRAGQLRREPARPLLGVRAADLRLLQILLVHAREPRGEAFAGCGLVIHLERPVLDRNERLDCILALADQAQRDALHASG